MRPLTIEEVNRIGEAVCEKLPQTAAVEWKYYVGKKSDSLIFSINK